MQIFIICLSPPFHLLPKFTEFLCTDDTKSLISRPDSSRFHICFHLPAVVFHPMASSLHISKAQPLRLSLPLPQSAFPEFLPILHSVTQIETLDSIQILPSLSPSASNQLPKLCILLLQNTSTCLFL